MKRLLRIEFQKLWSARYFRILLILWILAFILIPFGADAFLDFLESKGVDLKEIGIKPSDLPIFDFDDIWQNLAYVYKCLGILLSFIIIISVTNDFDYRTFRQNVIDGMSRTQWLVSKLYLILFMASVSAVLVLILGLIAGFAFSHITAFGDVVENIAFIGAYWLQVFLFLNLCLLLSLVIRRAGITLAVLIFWVYIFEPIGATMLTYWAEKPLIADLLPFEASWNLIPSPILKYAFVSSESYIGYAHLGIAAGYTAICMMCSWRIVSKRDL